MEIYTNKVYVVFSENWTDHILLMYSKTRMA
jgi:hypothetical protein